MYIQPGKGLNINGTGTHQVYVFMILTNRPIFKTWHYFFFWFKHTKHYNILSITLNTTFVCFHFILKKIDSILYRIVVSISVFRVLLVEVFMPKGSTKNVTNVVLQICVTNEYAHMVIFLTLSFVWSVFSMNFILERIL